MIKLTHRIIHCPVFIYLALFAILLPISASGQEFIPLPSPGQKAMSAAIEKGDLEAVKHFVEEDNPQYYLTVADSHGYTALHDAADYNQPIIVDYLIKKGADINAQSTNGVTPITIASHRNHIKVIQLLADAKADPNIPTKKGVTGLFYASEFNYPEAVKILLKAGANPNHQSHYSGVFPLILATQGGFVKITKMLIDAGANPRTKAGNGLDSVAMAKKYQADNDAKKAEWNKVIALLEATAKTAPQPAPRPKASSSPEQNAAKQLNDNLNSATDQALNNLLKSFQESGLSFEEWLKQKQDEQ